MEWLVDGAVIKNEAQTEVRRRREEEEQMKLSVLSPLVLVCSNLLLQDPHPLLTAVAFPINTNAPAQVITVGRPGNKIFHPATGTCVLGNSMNDQLKLGPCEQSSQWEYTPQKFLKVRGTYFCLQAKGAGEAAKLGIRCFPSDSSWAITPDPAKKQPRLATELQGIGSLCLDVGRGDLVVANPCSSSDTQWFEITPMDAAGSSTLVASASSSDSSP